MSQTLVIQEKYYNSLLANLDILRSKGYSSADDFVKKIIVRLNYEFSYLEIV